jgi:hypothetical protein
MTNWKKVGIDIGVGGVAGVVSQVLKSKDIDRLADYNAKLAADGKPAAPQIPWTKRFSTYFSYGVPIASIGAVAANKLTGDWATRALTVGGVLAGGEGMRAYQNRSAIKGGKSPVYFNAARWSPSPQLPSGVPPADVNIIAPNGAGILQPASTQNGRGSL